MFVCIRRAAFLLSVSALPFLSGCSTPYAACRVGALTTASSGSPNFTLAAQDNDFTIFPGQTKQLAVAIEPVGNASGQVSVSAGGLQGITAPAVKGSIGSTVNLTVTASESVVSGCFTGVRDVFSAAVPLTVSGESSTGEVQQHIALNVLLENPAFVPQASSLPVFTITTANAEPVTSEDDYVDATLVVTNGAKKSYNITEPMGIKVHGNSTEAMPKKPYRLKLNDNQSLLGFSSSGNFILLANYDDKSLLRNDLSFKMSEMFGMFWTPNTTFVDVYLNGQYEGVYELAEKVEVSKAHLNIGSMDDTDTSGTNLTGGYLGEIDHYLGQTFHFTDGTGLPIGLDDPDPPVDVQAVYFKTAFTEAENSMYAANFTDPTLGWQGFWDKSSLVNWFLVEEIAANQDAADFSSDYFYKPRGDTRFYRGPVWDMDVTFGNMNDPSTTSPNPNTPWVSTHALWYQQLFKDPAFLQAVKDQYTAMRPQIATLPAYIDSEAANLSVAQANNFGRWPILGERVWPNAEAAGTYSGEVTFLKSWLAQRIAYMDSKYLNK